MERNYRAEMAAIWDKPITGGKHAVTESIYSGKALIVPLADVQHIETHHPHGLIVVTRHTRWDHASDTWANNIWINADEAEAFKAAWCRYRHELEIDTLADLTPSG